MRPEDIAVAIVEGVQLATEPLKKRLADVETQLAELRGEISKAGDVPYAGVWRRDADCQLGKFYTHAGSLWFATSASKGIEPGTGHGWKLVVKRGEAIKLEQGNDRGRTARMA